MSRAEEIATLRAERDQFHAKVRDHLKLTVDITRACRDEGLSRAAAFDQGLLFFTQVETPNVINALLAEAICQLTDSAGEST